jgi:hypothetical protein
MDVFHNLNKCYYYDLTIFLIKIKISQKYVM